jgi:hypothetical protein
MYSPLQSALASSNTVSTFSNGSVMAKSVIFTSIIYNQVCADSTTYHIIAPSTAATSIRREGSQSVQYMMSTVVVISCGK